MDNIEVDDLSCGNSSICDNMKQTLLELTDDVDSWNKQHLQCLIDYLPEKVYIDLSNVDVRGRIFKSIDLSYTLLENSSFSEAVLTNADFSYTKAESANFAYSDLSHATFVNSNLKNAIFIGANLTGAKFMNSNLEGAYFSFSQLEQADFSYAIIKKADFTMATVDGKSIFYGCPSCYIDKDTNFSGVTLSAARITPQLLSSLEKNIRRFEWKKWYSNHRISSIIVRLFWYLSDYGTSAFRVIVAYFIVHLLGLILYIAPIIFINKEIDCIMVLSIVSNYVLSMFGVSEIIYPGMFYDMATIFVSICSYFILAVLVTLFAIMFQNKSY